MSPQDIISQVELYLDHTSEGFGAEVTISLLHLLTMCPKKAVVGMSIT